MIKKNLHDWVGHTPPTDETYQSACPVTDCGVTYVGPKRSFGCMLCVLRWRPVLTYTPEWLL